MDLVAMGITFYKDVADIRNTKVVDLVKELMDYSLNVHVVDPHASANEVAHEYGISLIDEPAGKYDAIVIAVGHREYKKMSEKELKALSRNGLVLFDIKGVKTEMALKDYWKL